MNEHQRRTVNVITLVIAAFTLGYQIGERITEYRWIKELTSWRKRVG